MAPKIEIRQTLEQRLVLTPALQQAIALLQQNHAELINTIRKELQENPALDDAETGTLFPRDEGLFLGSVSDEDTSYCDAGPDFEAYFCSRLADFRPEQAEERMVPPSYDDMITSPTSLTDYLLWQLEISAPTARHKEIGEFIIGHISAEGYLAVPFDEIVALLGAILPKEIEEVEETLRLIQSMDPPGVGARNLKECLSAQIEALGLSGTLVETLVKKHLFSEVESAAEHFTEEQIKRLWKSDVAAHRWDEIAKTTGRTTEEVIEAYNALRHLHPKPGLQFSPLNNEAVVPDAFVSRSMDGKYRVMLNDDGMPKLRISSSYKRLLNENDNVTRKFVKEKLQRAQQLIKAIYQRHRTMTRVIESIIEKQKDFFDHGLKFLKPLALKNVAAEVGCHTSTVSRVIHGKYIHTPRGTFELKFFFSQSLSTSEGGEFSNVQVKESIKELIEKEEKPLSDSQIAKLLKAQGINIARRTVAKYREELNIPPSLQRVKL